MIFGMTVQEFLLVLGGIGTLAGVIASQVVLIIKANAATRAVEANTLDRAAKTAETLAVLGPIATQVNDIHAGTGNGTTVNVPPPAPPNP